MYEENEQPVNSGTATEIQEQLATPTPEVATQPVENNEKTYTKNEVIDMMRKRVDRSHQAFFNRYKVKDLSEMDAMFGKIAEYEKQIADLGVTNAGLVKSNAYLTHNINPDRYGDIEAYFKGKDMKIDIDTLAQEIQTHPEWLKVIAPTTTIKAVGAEKNGHPKETELDIAKKLLNF